MSEETTYGPGDVTRLAEALKQAGEDALAIEAMVDDVAPWLPEHLTDALRARAADIARTVRRTGDGAAEQMAEIKARAYREDLTKRALVERIGQLDAARVAAAAFCGADLKAHWADEAAERRAMAGAEAFAAKLGLSSADWQRLLATPADVRRRRVLGEPEPKATAPVVKARKAPKKAAKRPAKVKAKAKKGGRR